MPSYMPKAFALHTDERHSECARPHEWKSLHPVFAEKVQEVFGYFDKVGVALSGLEEIQHRERQYGLLWSATPCVLRPPAGALVGVQASKQPEIPLNGFISGHAGILATTTTPYQRNTDLGGNA